MKIAEALKKENIRLSMSGRWMFWDGNNWVVCEHKYYARRNTVLIRTESEDKAVAELVKE
jgi:hypothetical protein